MTSYRLAFDPRALREFRKLGSNLQDQARKKLRERLVNPRVQADRLHDFPDCYKVMLRSDGYRVVYQVRDREIVVVVIAIGKRDDKKADVYAAARARTVQS